MSILRADGSLLARDCPLIDDDTPRPDAAHAISLTRWQDESGTPPPHALAISNDVDVLSLDLPWGEIDEIWLEFPNFVFGQAYSQARLLRTRMAYDGLLLARGDVLLDQLYYMLRCGFDAFELRSDQNLDACRKALAQFSSAYVSASNQRDGVLTRRIA